SSARGAPAAPPVVHSMAELLKQARPPTPLPGPDGRRDPRERKYVYVLEGVLRGLAALERRLGARGAARLVDEFYQVARDIAFKHEALLGALGPPGTGDGHEATLRVVIGLPVPSEDDAGRAIRLALCLVDARDG